MEYTNTFKNGGTQYVPPIFQPNVNPTQTGMVVKNQNGLPGIGVYWVQGPEGAKGYYFNTPNTETYLRDSENTDILYIKSTDALGRPQSLQTYRLTQIDISELEQKPVVNNSQYVTIDQFEELSNKIDKLSNQLSNRNNNRRKKRPQQNQVEEAQYDE